MNKTVLVIGLYGQSILLHVDQFPADGETVSGELIAIEPGGKGYNQAVSVARNKIPTRFITAVSIDEFGVHLSDDCEAEGIDGSFSITIPNYHTAIASVMSDSLANSRVIVSKGVCEHFKPEYLKDEAFTNCAILLLQLELPIELALYAAKKAKEQGALIILDPAPAKELPNELIDLVDIVTPNLGESLELSAGSPVTDYESVAQKLHEQGWKNILITLGEAGVYVSLASGQKYLKPAVKAPAIDSTGAGDTFNGSLAAYLYAENDLSKAIEYAVAASSLSVTRKGVMASIPYKVEIENYMADIYNKSGIKYSRKRRTVS